MEDWEYLEEFRHIYLPPPQPLESPDLSSNSITPEGYPHPLVHQDHNQENPNVPQDHQGEDLPHSNTTETFVRGDELCNEEIPPDNSTDLSSNSITPEGYPHPLVHQDHNQENPNVPQDHQAEDLFHSNTTETYVRGDELCNEEIPPDNSTDLSSNSITPETCPRPLVHQDCNQENPNVPQDHQGEDLPHSNTTETFVRGNEAIPPDNCTDLSSNSITPETCPRPLVHQDCNQENPNVPQDHQVPVRCQGVTVYFSMEVWEFLEEFRHIFLASPQPLASPDLSSNSITPEGYPHPLVHQDHNQENPNVPQDHQGEDLLHSNTTETFVRGDELCNEEIPPDNSTDLSSNSITPETCPRPLVHQDCNQENPNVPQDHQVPSRCQGVTVCFSMEEWEFLEEFRHIFQTPPHPLASPDLSSNSITPETCPRPLVHQDCNQENPNVPQDHQGEDLLHSNTTETFVRGDELCNEEIPPDNSTDLSSNSITPETCPRPLVHQDCNQENPNVPQDHQVPVRCQGVTVQFSMEQWEFLEEFRHLFQTPPHPLASPDLSSNSITPETCPRPLLHQDCNQENPNVPQDHQGEDLPHSNTTETYVRGDERCNEEIPPDNSTDLSSNSITPETCPCPLVHQDCNQENPNVPQDHQGEDLLHSNTTETYVRGDEWCNEEIPPDNSTDLSSNSITPETCPCPLVHQDCNQENPNVPQDHQVPSRCQGVTVYFSMEQWDFLEEFRHLFLTPPQSLASPDLSSNSITPETCPCPLVHQDCNKEYPNVPQDQQGEDLFHSNTTETFVRGDELCNEEIPPDSSTDGCNRSSEVHLSFSNFKADGHSVPPDSYEEQIIIPDPPPSPHIEMLSTDPFQQVLSSDSLQTIEHSKNNRKDMQRKRTYKAKKPLSCPECEKCFTSKSHLVAHRRIHTGEKPFSCSECGNCFTQKGGLVLHKKIHAKEKPYSCSECGKSFTRKSHLVIHLRIHTGEKPFSCTECGNCFTQKGDLVKHKRIHTREKPYSCSECGISFIRKSHLVIHLRTHTGEKPFSCPECEKCFTSKSHLVAHRRIHTGEKPFSCSECGKCFTKKGDLVIHQRSHTKKKPFLCSDCGKCFTQKGTLVNHQRIHTGEKPFSCSECGKCFTKKGDLVIHQRSHTKEKPFLCSDCGKCFTQKGTLVNHQRIHTGEKPFSCPECEKCFTKKSHLVAHRRIHTGEKPFSCSECGKCFTWKGDLVIHQRSHTKEKPFSCSDCGKSFTQKGTLVYHQRIHTGEKRFSCSECGKCFSQKGDLVMHKRIHTGEKPYLCSECGECFISNFHLVIHQRIHSGEQPFSCPECGDFFPSKSRLVRHQRIHTGEKPFSCTECGKCFTQKGNLVIHMRIHTS
ncbi:uncharacterized protein [Dendrobates tinctorius]|uniref:uncharacterized protein isoform X1 n=1 Tax=Dendrobates tinctorius TaxID=92724 RepID=UPI003CC9D85B